MGGAVIKGYTLNIQETAPSRRNLSEDLIQRLVYRRLATLARELLAIHPNLHVGYIRNLFLERTKSKSMSTFDRAGTNGLIRPKGQALRCSFDDWLSIGPRASLACSTHECH